jgi:GAF domain-containing protein
VENLTDEVLSLRRTLRDLVALTSLPAVWVGSKPYEIAESLSDVLFRTCPHLDLVYILLTRFAEENALELVCTGQGLITGDAAQKIREAVAPLLKGGDLKTNHSIADPINGGSLEITVIPMGHSGKVGFVVAGVRLPHTLSDFDRLLLNVATNQAVTALQQAQLLTDLRTANQLKDAAFIQEQTSREHMVGLQTITAALSQAVTVEQVAHVVVDQMVTFLKAGGGVFY